MKKFYLFFFLLIGQVAIAQTLNNLHQTVTPIDQLDKGQLEQLLQQFNVEGMELKSCILNQKKPINGDIILSDLDTLKDYLNRSSGFAAYGININNQTYPMTGWNPLYHFLGSRSNISGEIKVTGFLAAYRQKMFVGNRQDTIYFRLYPTQNNVPSGNVLAFGKTLVTDIDTSTVAPVFTPMMFQQPAVVNTNFACLVSTFDNTQEYDLTVVYSNMNGDANGQTTPVVLIFQQNGSLVSATLAQLLAAASQNQIPDPDFDLMILPIVDFELSGINDEFTINGFTYKGLFPNPASSKSSFSFTTEFSADMKISLTGLNGGHIITLYEGYITPGGHTLELNFDDVPSGSYYFTLVAGKAKFGGKIIVNK